MEKPIAAIELGSKKAKLVIGYELNGKPYVLYTLLKPYGERIIEDGNFIDFAKAVQTIKDLTSFVDPSVKLKFNISDVVIALPPYGLDVLKTKQTTGTTNEQGKITNFDVKNLYSIIRNCNNGSKNSLVDIVPRTFILDQGRIFAKMPIGETSRILTVIASLHSLPARIVNDYTNAVTNGKMNVKRSIVAPFAASELIATDPNMPKNYFLVDIGSNTTTVSLIGNNELYSSTHFNWGGDNITQQIVASFNINEAEAEKYKISYGIDKRIMNFKAPVCVTNDGNGHEIKHFTDELNAIITSELDDFTDQLTKAVDELCSKNDDFKRIPLVLIGGGSRLYGLVDYIQTKVYADQIFLYTCKTLGGRNASLTTCLGMILACAKYPINLDESHTRVGALNRETNPVLNK